MIVLIQANIIPLAAAMLIGILTARWMFRRTRTDAPFTDGRRGD